MAPRDILHQISGDLRLALGLLTRLPLPGQPDMARGAAAAWAWPLAGLAPALLAGLAIWLTSGLGAGLSAALALAVMAMVTGAMHEDGLADTADGLWGGWTVEQRLEIMKDSRIGSYGALGLGLAVALRAALLISLPVADDMLFASTAIIASACFARALVVAAMALIAPAPAGSGLAKDIGSAVRPRTVVMGALTAFPALAAFALLDGRALLATVLAAGVFLIWLRGMLLRRIGGSTGDCLGFAAYAGQLILLLAVVALGDGE
mgnify:CR=1 FL=1